jgi:3-phosphoglycerate kinase
MTAIIGGNVKSISEIIDKLLLVNSLLDTSSAFILVGEIGLAALHCLGFKVGKVERSENNLTEY